MDTTKDIVLISSDKTLQDRADITSHLTMFSPENKPVDGSVMVYHLPAHSTVEQVESALNDVDAAHVILVADLQDLTEWVPSLFLLPVDGIVELASLSEQLPYVLECLNQGYYYLDTNLQNDLIASLVQLQNTRRPIERFRINPMKCTGLNQTEQQVLERLANGQSTANIAKERNCSIATVYLASTKLVKFFDVKDRTDAVVSAIRSDHLIPEKGQ